MPLDEIGRRYADSIFQRSFHEVADNQKEQIVRLRNQHASRGSILSGGYIKEHCALLLQGIDTLAQAKLDGLVKAYEKSDLPFDEAAFQEVTKEVMGFCHSQQHNIIGSSAHLVHQTFGQNTPEGTYDSVSQGIVAGIDGIMSRLSCDLAIRRDETALEDRRAKKAYAAALGKRWDVFVCHASEDKEDFVDPLAHGLRDSGLSVWYDVFSLKVGNSLRRKIDEGLLNSRYGVVVLSKYFFSKEWPQSELDGLMSREIAGTKVILPVWYKITAVEVGQHSPILAGRVAAKSEMGIQNVITAVREAMGL
jgi:hypothetical protein